MKCNKCNKDKPTTDFYADKKSPTGLTRDCKECRLTSVKGSNYYPPTRRLPTSPKCNTCGSDLKPGRHHGRCDECRKKFLESLKSPPRKLMCEMCGVEIVGRKSAKYCGACAKERHIARDRSRGADYARNSKLRNPKRAWCRGTISTHSTKYSINITTDELENYVQSRDACEICGKQLNWLNATTRSDSPSLDRLNNEQTIDINNIQLLCHECNTTKGKRTMKQFIEYCTQVSSKFRI